MRKKAVSVVLILADLILLVLFVFVFRGILRSVAGFDVIEYENWNGELENPLVLRLGTGFWGFMVILVRLIVFIICQVRLLKGNRVMMAIVVILHTVIAVLGVIYWLKWGDGPYFTYMLQLLFERLIN